MMNELTCIMCPNSCRRTIASAEEGYRVEGNACRKGEEFAIEEMTAPKRNFATSVLVKNGDMPLCSVRLSRPIAKELMFSVLEEIHKLTVEAPVLIGDVLIENILDTGADVIATRDVGKAETCI